MIPHGAIDPTVDTPTPGSRPPTVLVGSLATLRGAFQAPGVQILDEGPPARVSMRPFSRLTNDAGSSS